MSPSDQIVLSHFTLARHAPFRERVEAAARAGFSAIGLYVGDYVKMRAEGTTDADFRAVLAEFGQSVAELEALKDWARGGDLEAGSRTSEEQLYAMADGLGGVRAMQVVGSYDGNLDDAAERFAALCDRAAEHGLTPAIEFLPEMTNIGDARTALEIAIRAGRPNGGLCVDAWHHERGANDLAQLRALPVERVITVQLDDGLLNRTEPDYYTDCTQNRLAPGEGEFDLVGFIRTIDGLGVSVPFSIEVISTHLLELPPIEVAQRVADAARAVLATARAATPE